MDNSFVTAYTIISVIIAAIGFYYSKKSFQKTEIAGRFLGLAAIAAAIVDISYLISILTNNYVQNSIASSVYFCGIDWMLVSLVHFVYLYTGLDHGKTSRAIRHVLRMVAMTDTLVFTINIILEIAVHYVYHEDRIISHFTYDMKALYIVHLVFTYIMVFIVVGILVHKCILTPAKYRNQFILVILSILLVVVVNAVFLYIDRDSPFTMIDYSIIGYSVALFLIYWSAFDYRKNNMLKSLSMTIFENINQGIVLFDYSDELIMHNDKAADLLTNIEFKDKMPAGEFMKNCELSPESYFEDQFSVQCELRGLAPLRCDFRKLHDERGTVIGNLFVFTDISVDTDLLTGFEFSENFKRSVAENPYNFDHPTTAVMFDIIGLGEVNKTFGRDIGDQRIRSLSMAIREFMPPETYFVRGYEAHLIAICSHCTENDIMQNIENVVATTGNSILYGVSSTLDRSSEGSLLLNAQAESRNILQAIDTAARALQVKKLLSPRSIHSQTLTSLVKALNEADSDTEEHVERTQNMGTLLGKRIGLTDAQLADLKLLCLLHDIGKIGIPLEILNKPGKLTPAEWDVLHTHAEKGYQIAMSSDELKGIAPMILSHHERWDGKGYPEHLAGQNIPLLSRVISIVDTYDAMVNNRSYRKALTSEEAKAEIRRCAGTQFDPKLSEEFLAMLEAHPEVAEGVETGGEEVRVFMQNVLNAEDNGTTFAVPYSRYLLNLDDVIIDIDDYFMEITGYTRQDVVDKMSQYDLIPQEDRPFYIVQANNQFNKGDIAYLKHNIQRKDGTVVQIFCFGKRYFDSAAKAFRSEILIFRT